MKRTMPVVQVVMFLAFAVVACSASAQPKPALVQDRDEPGRNPYHQTINKTVPQACGGGVCIVAFDPVPIGMRLVVTHASAHFRITDTSGSFFATLSSSGGIDVHDLPAPKAALPNMFVTSTPITFYVYAGNPPVMTLWTSGTVDASDYLTVSISGYYVAIP